MSLPETPQAGVTVLQIITDTEVPDAVPVLSYKALVQDPLVLQNQLVLDPSQYMLIQITELSPKSCQNQPC